MPLVIRAVAVLVALALLAATVAGVLALLANAPARQSHWRPVGQIVLLSGAWLLANSPYEGRVLWVPARGHGLTTADLVVLPPLLVALLLAALRTR